MFCTNSWRKKVYTPLHSQSIKLYFVLKSICGMQLADASMYCAVCGEEAHLKMQFAYCIYRKYQSGKMLPCYFSQQQQSD